MRSCGGSRSSLRFGLDSCSEPKTCFTGRSRSARSPKVRQNLEIGDELIQVQGSIYWHLDHYERYLRRESWLGSWT